MELAIKFFSGNFSTVPTRTVQEVSALEIVKDLTSVSTAKFSVSPTVLGISTYQTVEIWEVGNPETLLFRGFVSKVRPSLQSVEVELKSEKGLLARKIATTDRSFSGSTVSAVLTQLFADWNSAYSEPFTVSSALATSVTKDVKQGDSLYDLIDELATLAGAVWTCENGVVTVAEVLGTDYTNPSGDFKELTFDATDPKRSNVADFSLETYSSVANVVLGTDGTTKSLQTDAGSRASFGALAEVKDFRSGDLAAQTAAYLARQKDEQSVFKAVPEPGRFTAEVGDKVVLTIENTNAYLDFSGSVFVTRKKLSLKNASIIAEYEVSERYVAKSGFFERFYEIEKDVDLSKIR